jgi:hypothetical protein
MYAVCYRNTDAKPEWQPYGGELYHFREFAVNSRDKDYPNSGKVLPVEVKVIMPKKRKRTS